MIEERAGVPVDDHGRPARRPVDADVVAAVVEVSEGHAYDLLEALATALADGLVDRFPLRRARVRVRKPDVVLPRPVEHAAVVVERRVG